jgi:hypothetical protein
VRRKRLNTKPGAQLKKSKRWKRLHAYWSK